MTVSTTDGLTAMFHAARKQGYLTFQQVDEFLPDEGGDPSDATLEVMHAQQASREPLAEDELSRQRVINTQDGSGLEQAIADLRQRLPGL